MIEWFLEQNTLYQWVIIFLSTTIPYEIISWISKWMFWEWSVYKIIWKVLKYLLEKLRHFLLFLINKFPYRAYNKNKYNLSNIINKEERTHYLKIHRDWAFDKYSWTLQDKLHKQIERGYHEYQSAKEALWDAKSNINFEYISESKETNIYRIKVFFKS